MDDFARSTETQPTARRGRDLPAFSRQSASSNQQFLWSYLYEPFFAAAKLVGASRRSSDELLSLPEPSAETLAVPEVEAVTRVADEAPSEMFHVEQSGDQDFLPAGPASESESADPAPLADKRPERNSFEAPSLDALRLQTLLEALGPEAADEFAWVATTDTIETYEHRQTMRYLHIDRLAGEFFNQQCEAVSRESALRHARRPATVPASADIAATKGTEPVFRAFTRRESSEQDTPFWNRLAAGFQSSSSVQTGENRRGKLAESPAFQPERSGSQAESAARTSYTPEAEPAFATFTRRTSGR